jgi:hypothetical protein
MTGRTPCQHQRDVETCAPTKPLCRSMEQQAQQPVVHLVLPTTSWLITSRLCAACRFSLHRPPLFHSNLGPNLGPIIGSSSSFNWFQRAVVPVGFLQFQVAGISVTAEVASSSLVVPASFFNDLPGDGPQRNCSNLSEKSSRF